VSTTTVRLRDVVNGHIVDHLDQRGMTAQDVAESTGIGIRAVENRISSFAPWTVDEIHLVAVTLDVDVVSLFQE